ncbi:MAG: hypothetical protein K2G26_00140 [Clostridia bacterium]|nr:hypothetical protein [Clostridia bacterium]
MKALKVSKRLLKAIIALAASIILCGGICLAWFAMNDKVGANGANTAIKDINIKDFEVKAYELKTPSYEGGVTTYSVGNEVAGPSVEMSAYGEFAGGATALLLEFSYTFNEDLGKDYAIFAYCKDTYGEITSKTDGSGLVLDCALSSVISFYEIAGSQPASKPSTVTVDSEKENKDIDDTDGSIVTIQEGIKDTGADGTKTIKFYCIIDYAENKIYSQYSRR